MMTQEEAKRILERVARGDLQGCQCRDDSPAKWEEELEQMLRSLYQNER